MCGVLTFLHDTWQRPSPESDDQALLGKELGEDRLSRSYRARHELKDGQRDQSE